MAGGIEHWLTWKEPQQTGENLTGVFIFVEVPGNFWFEYHQSVLEIFVFVVDIDRASIVDRHVSDASSTLMKFARTARDGAVGISEAELGNQLRGIGAIDPYHPRFFELIKDVDIPGF